MKRGIAVLVSLSALVAVAYFTASKWAIRHETLALNDPARDNRPVVVDIAVRRDKEMQATADMITLPVAILNHGNTVRFTEYSFLTNYFAMRGYLAISIQHDLPTDAPMVTKLGELYVGRQPQYLRGIANIKFAVEEMKKVQPSADYDRLTVVGHSAGRIRIVGNTTRTVIDEPFVLKAAENYFERWDPGFIKTIESWIHRSGKA